MNLSEEDRRTFKTRQERYGTFIQAHKNLGLLWTGLLQNHFRIKLPGPIPSHVVLLMMTASKLNRAVAEELLPDEDNYVDAKIYTAMAQKARIQYGKEKDKTMAKKTGKKKPDSDIA